MRRFDLFVLKASIGVRLYQSYFESIFNLPAYSELQEVIHLSVMIAQLDRLLQLKVLGRHLFYPVQDLLHMVF